jgi:hypothetical protein
VISTLDDDRNRLQETLRRVWSADSAISRLGLSFLPNAIEQQFGAWIVPVNCSSDAGASEIISALSHLQDRVEMDTKLNVLLVLEPELN